MLASALAKRIEEEHEDAVQGLPRSVTLLELVEAVNAVADTEEEVIATVVSMLLRGRVRLRGNFLGEPVECFLD